eukprot:774894-Rhodomonas_salina.2
MAEIDCVILRSLISMPGWTTSWLRILAEREEPTLAGRTGGVASEAAACGASLRSAFTNGTFRTGRGGAVRRGTCCGAAVFRTWRGGADRRGTCCGAAVCEVTTLDPDLGDTGPLGWVPGTISRLSEYVRLVRSRPGSQSGPGWHALSPTPVTWPLGVEAGPRREAPYCPRSAAPCAIVALCILSPRDDIALENSGPAGLNRAQDLDSRRTQQRAKRQTRLSSAEDVELRSDAPMFKLLQTPVRSATAKCLFTQLPFYVVRCVGKSPGVNLLRPRTPSMWQSSKLLVNFDGSDPVLIHRFLLESRSPPNLVERRVPSLPAPITYHRALPLHPCESFSSLSLAPLPAILAGASDQRNSKATIQLSRA